MKKSFRSIALFVLALLGVSGFFACDKSSNYKSLVAREWALEKVIHKDSTSEINIPSGVYIIFSDSSMLYGNAGCNNFFGKYETVGYNQLGIGPMGATQMWCFNMDFETAYLNMLEHVQSYAADEKSLVLSGSDDAFTLHYVPQTISNGGDAKAQR